MTRITKVGSWNGTVEFTGYKRLNNEKGTLYIGYRCTEQETGDTAEGKLWCTPKAIGGTIELLRDLGVEGETARDVCINAANMIAVDCSFDTVASGEYINADQLRPRGAKGSGVVEETEWFDAVFGAATPPVQKLDTQAPASPTSKTEAHVYGRTTFVRKPHLPF